MTLSRHTIQLWLDKKLTFTPKLTKYQLRSSGAIDLMVGCSIQRAKPYNPNEPLTTAPFDLIEIQTGTPFLIAPKETILIQTSQVIKMSGDCIGWVRGRTSMMRKGLLVGHTGAVDPHYEGRLLVPVTNVANYPLAIRAGERFCSLYLEQCDMVPEDGTHLSKYHLQSPAVGALPEIDPAEEELIRTGKYHS